MAKGIAWVKLKAEYLQGVTPKELGEKYGLTAKQISDKANKENWVAEKARICEKVRENTEEKIDRITSIALRRLEDVLLSDEVRPSDLVNAIGKAFDISGLKSSKQEITGSNGAPLVQQTYLTPEECKAAINHIKDFINNG